MAQLPTFDIADLAAIVDCTLKFNFMLQMPLPETNEDILHSVILQTINYLHAEGGPFRLSRPAILRDMARFVPKPFEQDVALHTTARQIIASYHHRLKTEWANVIASHEPAQLNIRLPRGVFRIESVIDRVDKSDDGGITAVRLMPTTSPIIEPKLDDIEPTLLHALVAAAYPNKRPVRISYLWLYHDQVKIVELTEKQYCRNIERVKQGVQAWLGDQVLARPGPYCERCPFQYNGCPIYPEDTSHHGTEPDLPQSMPPANLPRHE